MNTDRIEKKLVLNAPRSRVWQAISRAEEFGKWFGVVMEGSFSPGKAMVGRIRMDGKFDGMKFELQVERIEPETLFSYRWHPYAIDPKVDYSSEKTTLVEFHLEDLGGRTELTVIESGFDQIPLARRAEAFRMNDGGWAQQLQNIERHVTA